MMMMMMMMMMEMMMIIILMIIGQCSLNNNYINHVHIIRNVIQIPKLTVGDPSNASRLKANSIGTTNTLYTIKLAIKASQIIL